MEPRSENDGVSVNGDIANQRHPISMDQFHRTGEPQIVIEDCRGESPIAPSAASIALLTYSGRGIAWILAEVAPRAATLTRTGKEHQIRGVGEISRHYR